MRTDRAAKPPESTYPDADLPLRRLPVVMLEQPAQPHPAPDRSCGHGQLDFIELLAWLKAYGVDAEEALVGLARKIGRRVSCEGDEARKMMMRLHRRRRTITDESHTLGINRPFRVASGMKASPL